jgi:M6 family metalloprotease-like protein
MKKQFPIFCLLCLLSTPLLGCGEKGSESASSNAISSSSVASFLKDGLSKTGLSLQQSDEYQGEVPLSSTGIAKVLVVPVQMGDGPEFTSEQLARIQSVFFDATLSTKSATNYYSLSEYYAATSLNKLTISGEVLPVLKCAEKVADIETDHSYVPGVPAYHLREKESEEFLKGYDQNNDGYVDSVVFIYSAPFQHDDAYYWAFTSTFAKQTDGTKPSFGRHIWMSVDFLQSEGYTSDGHTIIHEFGHMLGLRDYYPTDNAYLALGGMSMMDYNILDHDPYSKMMLGWAEPLYYQVPAAQTTTITLKPFEGTNQFILLNDNWDHSAMAEYLLFEYYTPTGLNERDSSKRYIATTAQRPLGFTKKGLKVYHVDSRMAKISYDTDSSTYLFTSYVDSIPSVKESGVSYQIGANNSDSYSYTDARRKGRYKQIALVENKSENNLQSGATADEGSLFYEGDSFDSSTNVYLPNGLFNDKSTIGYKVHVDSLADTGATITITKDSL